MLLFSRRVHVFVDIDDVIIQENKISYVVLERGGFLG